MNILKFSQEPIIPSKGIMVQAGIWLATPVIDRKWWWWTRMRRNRRREREEEAVHAFVT
jgi:hypothetical protein